MELIATLISHFYNEEYLLPWWLMHHTQIFDHGILINRGSTDRSVEICRQFAPHWEVRNSRVPEFDAVEADNEVIDIEKECSGWKMILNTTEFLCFRNKMKFFNSLHDLGERMYFIRWILMADPPNYGYMNPVYTLPLVRQRFHGSFFYDPHQPYVGRLIHNYEHGSYTTGRHWSTHPYSIYPYPAFVLKFVFSPWNDAMRQRKLQIGPTLSAASVQRGYGVQHLTNPQALEQSYLNFAHTVEDLRLIPEYQYLWSDTTE